MRRIATAAAFAQLSCALAACGDDLAATTDTNDVATASDAADTQVGSDTADSAEPADTTVADTADTVETGCVPEHADGCSSIDWAAEDEYPNPVDHHTTLVHTTGADSWLYVIGGATLDDEGNITAHTEVRRAKIGGDGFLGAWEDEAAMSQPIAFAGQATSADHVYLGGGITEDDEGVAASNASWFGSFDGSGHLTFVKGPSLPAEIRVHPTAHFLGERVVIVGGTGGADDKPLHTTLVANVKADATLDAWSAGPDMPTERSHHAGVVHDGRIYLFGGFDIDNEPIADVWRSTLDEDGAPDGWEVVGTMVKPPWTHAATLYRDGVLIVGGGDGGPGEEEYIDRVRWARFAADGTVGTFVDVVNPLPTARSHVHQVPIHNGFIYSVGGRDHRTFTSIGDVFVGYLGF